MSAERGGAEAGGGDGRGEGRGDNGSEVEVSRSLFPASFVFGTATAAYQVEGAATEGGRGPSTWDAFAHEPGNVVNGDTGDVACEQYHRYEEDAGLMADMGIDAYRLSISWSRILPAGKGEVNEEGVAYYDRLIHALLAKGITPYVTLFHWDTPLALEKEFGGWLSSQIVPCFAEYAAVCFSRFGDRVKHWITLNEPQCFCTCAYSLGIHAPGRSTVRPPPALPTRLAGTSTLNMRGAAGAKAAAAAAAAAAAEPGLSRQGDSAREPYIVGHNMLRAHAAAVRLYRERFQALQRGSIGITLDAEWAEPLSDSEDDRAAAQRRMEFQLGWLLDPLLLGRDYPGVMRERVSSRLPTFAEGELGRELAGSADFVGLNHYTSKWVAHDSGRDARLLEGTAAPTDMFADQGVVVTAEKDGVPIGRRSASEWLYEVPWGLRKLLLWITQRYGRPPIIITENGMDEQDDPSKTLTENLNDEVRIRFYRGYLRSVADAIRDGADVRGYFAWSFMDNFEWREGYSRRFGLHYVDYDNACARHPKASARWWAEFLRKGGGAATKGCSMAATPLSATNL